VRTGWKTLSRCAALARNLSSK